MENLLENVELTLEEAKSVYNNGGKLIISYTFSSQNGKDLKRCASFSYIDYGLSFDDIRKIYKSDSIKDVVYYTDTNSYESSKMCNLMCN
jgi:hypothetical protein